MTYCMCVNCRNLKFFLFFTDSVFKTVYLLSRASKCRTIFIIRFIASKSLKLRHMLICLDKLFSRKKNSKKLEVGKNGNKKQKWKKEEKTAIKNKRKENQNEKIETRKISCAFHRSLGCAFLFFGKAQLYFFSFSRSIVALLFFFRKHKLCFLAEADVLLAEVQLCFSRKHMLCFSQKQMVRFSWKNDPSWKRTKFFAKT